MSKPRRPFDTRYYREFDNPNALHHPHITEHAFPWSGNHAPIIDQLFGFDGGEDNDPSEMVEVRRGNGVWRNLDGGLMDEGDVIEDDYSEDAFA